jgi:hypothetical protein
MASRYKKNQKVQNVQCDQTFGEKIAHNCTKMAQNGALLKRIFPQKMTLPLWEFKDKK